MPKWVCTELLDMQLAIETEAEYLNRKLNFMWLAKHCRAFEHIQEVPSMLCLKTYSLCLWAILLTHQNICLKMAQGKDQSFASRFFNKYKSKGSQEHRVQESDVPHISEFTIMWDKCSKCSSLLYS